MDEKKKKTPKVRDALRARGVYPLEDAHLRKLTPQELETYLNTGKLPLLWRLRRKRKTDG